jgi:FkbM family methyltransferase
MEIARRLARGIVGTNSRLYRSGARALDFIYTIRKEGLETWRILNELGDASRNELPKSIALRAVKYPLLLRPGTQDASVVINNIIREEYGQAAPDSNPEWMIDAGGYIGDTAAYFLSKYPKLKAIVLEPNPPSYEIASQNLRPYGDRAILLKKGLYTTDQKMNFAGKGAGASIVNSGIEIECISILTILEQYSIKRIDIFKMDIEGTEKAIFSADSKSWLERTGFLIIEIHGQDIESLLSRVLKENRFSMKRYRSVWYCEPDWRHV